MQENLVELAERSSLKSDGAGEWYPGRLCVEMYQSGDIPYLCDAVTSLREIWMWNADL